MTQLVPSKFSMYREEKEGGSAGGREWREEDRKAHGGRTSYGAGSMLQFALWKWPILTALEALMWAPPSAWLAGGQGGRSSYLPACFLFQLLNLMKSELQQETGEVWIEWKSLNNSTWTTLPFKVSWGNKYIYYYICFSSLWHAST